MKNKIVFLIPTLFLLLFVSCNKDNGKAYSIAPKDNNLYITMPQPTENKNGLDWKGVSLSEVVEDIYQTLQNCNLNEQVFLYLRFKTISTDRYGNQQETFDEHFLMDLPILEVKKYKTSKFLDDYYHISDKICELAKRLSNGSNESSNNAPKVYTEEQLDSAYQVGVEEGLRKGYEAGAQSIRDSVDNANKT